jgi:hypothetical protein
VRSRNFISGQPLRRVVHPNRDFHSITPGLTGFRVPATGPHRGKTLSALPQTVTSMARLRGHRRVLAPAELTAIHPHAVQHGDVLDNVAKPLTVFVHTIPRDILRRPVGKPIAHG